MSDLAAVSPRLFARWAGALGAAYFQRFAAAWLLSWPVAQGVIASGVLQFPGGDALLFEPGGAMLVEVLHARGAALLAAYGAYWPLWVVLAALGIVPRWLIFRACAVRRGPRADAGLELARFASLGSVFWLARALVLALTVLSAAVASGVLSASRDERASDLGALAVLALGLIAAGALSVLHDASCGALVGSSRRARSALAVGGRALRARVGRLASAYMGLWCVRLAVVLGCAVAVRGTGAALSASLHQSAIVALIGARAAWTWWVVGAVRAQPANALKPGERPAASSDPG